MSENNFVNQENYPRDLVGYAGRPPAANWPGNAKIAVQFVINYEEGSERCILHGDNESEAFLSEMIGAQPLAGVRNISMESCYEYGSRSGFWRLHDLFTSRNIPVTVFGVAMALARNPDAVAAMKAADWEIACHGYRWLDYQYTDIEEEKEYLLKAIALHTKVTGSRPTGWYLGRCSPNTRRLVMEEGGFKYNSDTYADDLPYWVKDEAYSQLMVPYTLDTNDMRFATNQGFNTSEQFYQYLKDSFDTLYQEGDRSPKMMSIGLHCRLMGRPARFAGLVRFLDYINQYDRVWVCKREEIADHWREVHPL